MSDACEVSRIHRAACRTRKRCCHVPADHLVAAIVGRADARGLYVAGRTSQSRVFPALPRCSVSPLRDRLVGRPTVRHAHDHARVEDARHASAEPRIRSTCASAGTGLRCRTRDAQRRVSTALLVAISIVPTISLVLALTNEWHELLWQSPHTMVRDEYVGWVAELGPWLMLNEIYAYLLLFAGTVILGFELSSSKRYRKALVAVIAAPVITSALNVLSLSGWYPVPGFDLTTLGFALSALLMNDSVLRFGLLEVTPVDPQPRRRATHGRRGRDQARRPHHRSQSRSGGHVRHVDRSRAEPAGDGLHPDAAAAGAARRTLLQRRNHGGQPLVPRARHTAVERSRAAAGNGAGVPRHHRAHEDQAGDGAAGAHRLPDRPLQPALLHAAPQPKKRSGSNAVISR